MTTRTDDRYSSPIENRADLLSVFEGGEKPSDDWRIGTEHEKFVYRTADHRAPSYDEPGGIRDLLTGLTEFGWEPVVENGNVIALKGKDGNVSLEPAGQFELSGAALKNLHETCSEAARHLNQCKTVGERLELPTERVINCVDRYGNSSAATLPIALGEAHAQGRLSPGTRVLLSTFGAGFTWGAAVVEWGLP